MSVPNLFLRQTDPESIRAFLGQYEKHCRTVIARTKQLSHADGPSTTTTEAFLPMKRKYCVDAQNFTSGSALGFINYATSLDEMTYKQLRAYLDSEAKES